MGVASAFLLEVVEVVEAFFKTGRVAEDFGGNAELAVGGEGAEEQGSEAISLDWRECDAKDALFTPLEIQAGNVEVTSEWIREEEGVSEAPGFVLFPTVGDQSVTEFI